MGGDQPGVVDRHTETYALVNLASLAATFRALTGEPFPIIPTPSPTPPAADPADAVLIAALDSWAHRHHAGDNAHAAHAYQVWRTAKGL